MATYTTLEHIDLPGLSRAYGLSELTARPLEGGAANSSFHLSGPSGEYTLTILDNHDMDSAQRLANHTQAMSRLGVPTTEVVAARDGSLIVTQEERSVMVKKWIEGEVQQPLPTPLLHQAGRVLAQLHALDTTTPGLADVPVGTRRLSAAQLEVIAQFEDRGFASWLTERLRDVRGAEALQKQKRTLAHGDLFADNVVVRPGGRLSILDWETLSIDDPMLDLGMAAVGLAEADGILDKDRLDALVTGYQGESPLPETDASVLPAEIEHAALIIAFHRYYRHNIRFPNPSKSEYHLEMVKFVESVQGRV